mgnify:CR=1 FL=1
MSKDKQCIESRFEELENIVINADEYIKDLVTELKIDTVKQIEQLKAENERMKEALKYITGKSLYKELSTMEKDHTNFVLGCDILIKEAREALNKE